MLTMTDTLWAQLDNVNRSINAMPYRSDMELYGKDEYWDPDATAAGDCDDYALAKRKRMQEIHPEHAECFRLATCWVEGDDKTPGQGGYHAVLTVWTNRGVYVMDNRYREVMPFRQLPYRWDMVENPGQADWLKIEQ